MRSSSPSCQLSRTDAAVELEQAEASSSSSLASSPAAVAAAARRRLLLKVTGRLSVAAQGKVHADGLGAAPQAPVKCDSYAGAGPADVGWSVFGMKQYLLLSNMDSWDNQKTVCESFGATLTSIHTQAENEFVKNLASDQPTWLWIGVKPDADGNTNVSPTEWLDGTRIGYTSWSAGQPQGNEGPVGMYSTDWHDEDRSRYGAGAKAVCSKPLRAGPCNATARGSGHSLSMLQRPARWGDGGATDSAGAGAGAGAAFAGSDALARTQAGGAGGGAGATGGGAGTPALAAACALACAA